MSLLYWATIYLGFGIWLLDWEKARERGFKPAYLVFGVLPLWILLVLVEWTRKGED